MYVVRSGLIYHNLGNVYSRAYQREIFSEARKKKLLQLCRLYYDKGVKVFEGCDAPSELLDIQSDRIDLQHILFETNQKSAHKKKCLQTALKITSECRDLLQKIEQTEDANSEDVIEILKNFENQLQLTLKKLIRICMNESSSGQHLDNYKKVYGMTLQATDHTQNYVNFAKHLRNVLNQIKIV